MQTLSNRFTRAIPFATIVCLGAAVMGLWGQEPQSAGNFSRSTVDFGIVVSDINESLDFYQNALGFTKAGAFDVPADLAADTGLSDNLPFHIHVMVLGEDESATKVKLMQFKDAPGKKIDNSFIHSSYGVSYLTVFVEDIDAAVSRAGKHGVKPIAKGVTPLPKSIAEGIYLAIVRDPDGNMIELVGPKKAAASE